MRPVKPVTRARPLPSTSTRTVWSGSFRSCSTVASVPILCRPSGDGIVFRRHLLGEQQNLLFVIHHFFERAHGFLAAHEERHDHVGKHDDIAQRQNRRDDCTPVVFLVNFLHGVIRHLVLLPASPPACTEPPLDMGAAS